MDFRTYNLAALDLCQEVVDAVDPARHFALPTPCAPWPVEDLLRHMLSQHLRFGAAARGEDPEAASPLDEADLGEDPAATFLAATALLTESFAANPDDRTTQLPELGRPVPLGMLISFHFFDFVVHGWDLAVSIGAPFAPPAELSRLAAEVGQVIPDAARVPGGSFAPRVEVGADADELARLLGVAGRDPAWHA